MRGLGQEEVGVPFGRYSKGVIISASRSFTYRQYAALREVVKMEGKAVFLKRNNFRSIPNAEFP